MKPFTSNKEEILSNACLLQVQHLNLSQTPRKNKLDKLEVGGTASGLELTPLVSPARLSWTNSYLNLTSRLETIMTPVVHFGNIKAPMDQDEFDTNQHHIIHSRIIFPQDECQESENSSSSHEEQGSENINQSDDQNDDIFSKEFQSVNQTDKTPSEEIQFKRPPQNNLEDPIDKDSSSKKFVCNCKRTQCLKLYCDCFREGHVCGNDCQCSDCHNSIEFETERVQIKQILMKRNPRAFDRKIENNQHSKGCNCKKTGCLKKYCECYQSGLECGQHCKCEECKNGLEGKIDFYDKEERFKYTVKKERRMKEFI